MSKILKNYDTYVTDEKIKIMLTGIALNKSKKNSDFPAYVLGLVSESGSASNFGNSDPDPGRHQRKADPQHWF
jgi:hypothetical protein